MLLYLWLLHFISLLHLGRFKCGFCFFSKNLLFFHLRWPFDWLVERGGAAFWGVNFSSLFVHRHVIAHPFSFFEFSESIHDNFLVGNENVLRVTAIRSNNMKPLLALYSVFGSLSISFFWVSPTQSIHDGECELCRVETGESWRTSRKTHRQVGLSRSRKQLSMLQQEVDGCEWSHGV